MIYAHIGDVFQYALRSTGQVTIVFGHLGHNVMRFAYDAFRTNFPNLPEDPFHNGTGYIDTGPIEVQEGMWLWFVSHRQNNGINDGELFAILDDVTAWAGQHEIRIFVTNGVENTDHGMHREPNRASQDLRTELLVDYWRTKNDQNPNIRVTLVSLNDVFTRNAGRLALQAGGDALPHDDPVNENPAVHWHLANQCTPARIAPDAPPDIQIQIAALMHVVGHVCPDFCGRARGDGAWIFAPTARLNAARNRNLLTIWPRANQLRLDIRPLPPGIDGKEPFNSENWASYQHRMHINYQNMVGL